MDQQVQRTKQFIQKVITSKRNGEQVKSFREVSEIVHQVKIGLDKLFDKLKAKNEEGLKAHHKYFQDQIGNMTDCI